MLADAAAREAGSRARRRPSSSDGSKRSAVEQSSVTGSDKPFRREGTATPRLSMAEKAVLQKAKDDAMIRALDLNHSRLSVSRCARRAFAIDLPAASVLDVQ